MNNQIELQEAPIGSVDEKQYIQVVGVGGRIRHEGYFSDNNPYLLQLRTANRNQDKDALYELAVQWEADYANRQMQLEENQAILDEQRAYDSPVAQIQRQRAAGINLDIPSGSGGSSVSSGSNAQLANPEMADQQGQTKFSNSYDNLNNSLNVVNTVASVASLAVGGASQLMHAYSELIKIPSEIGLNIANAELASSSAAEIGELLTGKKKSIDLANQAQTLQNNRELQGFLIDTADTIRHDATDDEIKAILGTLGATEGEIPQYTDYIRKIHKNPQIKANWNRSLVNQGYSEAELATYTTDFISRMVGYTAQLEEDTKIANIYQAQMSRKLNEILSSSNMTENVASTMISESELAEDKVKQDIKEFSIYCRNFGERIDYAAQKCRDIDKDIQDIYTKAEHHNRSLTANEKAAVDALRTSKFQIYQSASASLSEFYSSLNNYSSQHYMQQQMINHKGDLRSLNGNQKIVQFNQAMFHHVVDGVKSGADIAQGAISSVGNIALLLLGGQGLRNLSKSSPIGFNNKPSTPMSQGSIVGSYYGSW